MIPKHWTYDLICLNGNCYKFKIAIINTKRKPLDKASAVLGLKTVFIYCSYYSFCQVEWLSSKTFPHICEKEPFRLQASLFIFLK